MAERSLCAPLGAVTALALAVPTASLPTDASPAWRAATAIHELRIDVDGASIRALCTGGERRVVLWHDVAGSAEGWRPVLERLDGRVGACAFDRPGSGESTPTPGARGWYELYDELRRIHYALGFERDYVIVAHGVAGLYARPFAAQRSRDVVGLVLVDPAHEAMPDELRPGMPRDAWERWMAERAEPNADGVAERSIDRHARVARLPPVPVTVITAMRRPDGEGWDGRFLREGARSVHAAILAGVADGRHVPAERSGRDVPSEQPDLVAEEIARVVRAAGG